MALLDALGLKAADRSAGGSQGDATAARIAELRPLISAIGDRGAQAALEERLGKLSGAQQAAAGLRDPRKRMALEQAMKESAERLHADVQRIGGGEPGDKPAAETAMPAPPDAMPAPADVEPPARQGGGSGDRELSPAETAGDAPDSMSDADRKAALRRWKKLGAIDGDTEALAKALGDKKDADAQAKARAEVKRLHGEIAKGQKPAIREVRPPAGPAQDAGGDRKPRQPKGGDDSGPKGDASMSEANKKKLEQAVRGSKANLEPIEIKDFGNWLKRTHDDADFHKHLLTPESTRAKVLEWMQEQGWKNHKNEARRNKFNDLRQKIDGDHTTGTRTSRADRPKGGNTDDGANSGKQEGTGGAHHGRASDGDTRGGQGQGDAGGKRPDQKGTGGDRDVGKSPGGGDRTKHGASDSTQGPKGGLDTKGSGTQAEGGGAQKGNVANRPKQGSKAEPDAKGSDAKKTGRGAKAGPKADPGAAAKVSNAALSAASRKFGGLLRDSRAKLNELAQTDPAAKDIVDALDKADLIQDVESFAKNPKGFTAAQAKNALIEMPFTHFGSVLDKTIADFNAKYPDVASLNRAPMLNGANLGQLRQQYEKAMAQLRAPRARAALIKVFFIIGVNDKTPEAEIKARLKAADKAIAQAPGLKPYVDAYYTAYDMYAFALAAANNQLANLEESYTKEVLQLAASLRVRAAALDRISTNLKGVADWIMDSPFILFPMGEAAWFDFDTLASRFGTFGNRLEGFANAVDARKTDYPAEMKRIEAAAKAMDQSLSSLL
ncbi:MAG: hypothetical protein ABIQ06_12525 [Caldimonas sp.]